MFESGAILIYLAEKTGKLLGDTPSDKDKTIQWVMLQMGGVGPMFGQLGFFVKFAGFPVEDLRPRERYIAGARRLLAVVDAELEGKDWIVGPYTIADIALAPWLNALEFCGARGLAGWSDLKNVPAYVERFFQRPAAERGRGIPRRPEAQGKVGHDPPYAQNDKPPGLRHGGHRFRVVSEVGLE